MDKIEIHQPNDALFKNAMGNKEVARDFLANRLPPEVLKRADLRTLQLQKSSFVDASLSQSHSDLVYSLQIDSQPSYCYVLIEAQTKEDTQMPLRLLRYNVELMEQHIKQHKDDKLPSIINLVLYAGKRCYKGSKRLIDAFSNPRLMSKYLYEPFLIDLNREEEATILKDKEAALFELLLRESRLRDFCRILENKKIASMIIESSYKVSSLLFIMMHDKHNPVDVLKKIPKLDQKTKNSIMSGLEAMQYRSRQEGRKEGRKEGKQEGMQKGKESVLQSLIKKGLLTKAQVDAELANS